MFPRISFFVLIACLLASCSSSSIPENRPNAKEDPKKVDTTNSRPEVFQGVRITQAEGHLYKPTPTQALDMPPRLLSSSSDESKREVENQDLEQYRVLPDVQGTRIIRENGKQWLEVDSDMGTVWKAMTAFWIDSGVGLVEQNPEIGYMETEWIQSPKDVENESSGAMKFARQFITSLTQSRTVLNRYRIRLEKLAESKTAVHVTHRWVAKKEKVQVRRISKFEWVNLPSDPERVSDFLQTIVLIFEETAATS